MILRARGDELMLHHAPSRMMNIGFIRCRQSLQNSRLWDCRRLSRNRSQRSVAESQRQRKDQPSSVLEDARERMIITLPDFYSPTNWESINQPEKKGAFLRYFSAHNYFPFLDFFPIKKNPLLCNSTLRHHRRNLLWCRRVHSFFKVTLGLTDKATVCFTACAK